MIPTTATLVNIVDPARLMMHPKGARNLLTRGLTPFASRHVRSTGAADKLIQ